MPEASPKEQGSLLTFAASIRNRQTPHLFNIIIPWQGPGKFRLITPLHPPQGGIEQEQENIAPGGAENGTRKRLSSFLCRYRYSLP